MELRAWRAPSTLPGSRRTRRAAGPSSTASADSLVRTTGSPAMPLAFACSSDSSCCWAPSCFRACATQLEHAQSAGGTRVLPPIPAQPKCHARLQKEQSRRSPPSPQPPRPTAPPSPPSATTSPHVLLYGSFFGSCRPSATRKSLISFPEPSPSSSCPFGAWPVVPPACCRCRCRCRRGRAYRGQAC